MNNNHPYPNYINSPMYNSPNPNNMHQMYPYSYMPETPIYNPYLNKNQNIRNFISLLEERGFTVQEGQLRYLDMLELASKGIIDNCLAQNVGAPYAACILPPAPGQESAVGQKQENVKQYPPNINYIAPGITYKLRPDEALIFIGTTPPEAYYFAFRSYVGFVQNVPMKDYSDAVSAGNENTGYYHMTGASLGDMLNNYNIWTNNTPRGSTGNPFNSSTIIISTADKNINLQMRYALEYAGYSPDIMNNDNIPFELVNMGLEKGKDTFMFVMRIAKWSQQNIGDYYLGNLNRFWKVLRITPGRSLTNINTWPVPNLRIKETCNTEFKTVPYIEKNLEHLRDEIVKKYVAEFEPVYLKTDLWIMSNYESIVQDFNNLADDGDALYLRTENFQFNTDEDFVVVYGIDHSITGKAVYYSSIVYGAELLNGVVGVFCSAEFKHPADEYFPYGYRNSKYYYSCKIGRANCKNCDAIVPYSTGNPKGKAYGVDNNKDIFLGFRIYVDHQTLVGPAPYDVVWDQAILFRKKESTLK